MPSGWIALFIDKDNLLSLNLFYMRFFFTKNCLTSLILPILLCFIVSASLQAQTFISPQFSISYLSPGYGVPMGLTFTGDGSKMFVWEKNGKVHVSNWNNTTKTYDLQSTLVLDITQEVGDWGDYGLLGFALDPNYNTNGHIYLSYVVDRHHLLYFGTGQYNPASNLYNNATIGRITRYTTFINGSQETIANPASRLVLLGETNSTGIPILHDSHGVGSLAFADDGTLLASTGDGASYDGIDTGTKAGSFYTQALADGIIRPEENVGAFRSQLLNSHNGKILRLDPATGNGVSSNPYYDAGQPRSAKSRVWAMGFRNPFRFIRKPGSGSTNPAIGDLGEIFVGDVGWNKWEELTIINEPGVNAGWPIYEGFTATENYPVNLNYNRDELNPLFGINGCTQRYFTFGNLLKQPTADNNRFLPNPCNGTVNVVYGNSNRFIHKRPTMAWWHMSAGTETLVGTFTGNNPTTASIGTPQSGVTGTPFYGNCAGGAVWYKGTRYGTKYDGTYFIGDYVAGWIKNITVPVSDQISAVEGFASNMGAPLCMVQSPKDSLIYYVNYVNNSIIRINYGGNRAPSAVISSSTPYGPSPHTVSFTGSGSSDPDNNPLTYLWNFGDGTTSTAINPSHSFGTGGNTTPASYTVTLTVTDNQGGSGVATKIISVNNTPPVVAITSPVNNTQYIPGPDTTYQLTANVSDDQAGSTLKYAWQTILRHNTHEHREAVDTNKITSATIARIGCNGDTYYYIITLTVTDAYGLVGMDSAKIFPACSTAPPVITTHPLSQATCEGAAVTFTSAVSDSPVPPVQWQVSTNNGTSWNDIAGATNASLQITPAFSANGNQYRAVWTNGFGPANSNAAILTVTAAPAAPTGVATQSFCSTPTVANLVATGTALKWYASVSGGNPLPLSQALVNGNHYYASQTIDGCESVNRLDVTVSITSFSNATLNGTNSLGTITSYLWTMISGPNIPTIFNPGSASTQVNGLVPGNYVFQLSLNSGASTSLVALNVNPQDLPAAAHAGYDRFIVLPTSSVTLNGNGSSGVISSYSWSLISGPNSPLIVSPNQVSTTVNGLIQGNYLFELVITDISSIIKKDTVQIIVNPASPAGSLPVIASLNTQTSTSASSVNVLTGVPAGALLVLTIAQADDQPTSANAVVSSSPALTWTKGADAQATGSGNAEIYTALFTAGGNINITTNWGVNGMSTVVYIITNFNSSYVGASATGNLQAAPSVTINTTQANSLIIGCSSDWSAINGASRVYRDGATETFYQFRSGIYTAYHYRKGATSIGTYTEGLTTPSTMKAGTALIEIKGTIDMPPIADAGVNQSIIIPGAPTGPAVQNFCNGAIVSDLTATGSFTKWYTSSTGGIAMLNTDSLVSGNHYYASQTVSGCEITQRLDVTVSITSIATPIISVLDNCDSTFTLSTSSAGTLFWSTGASTSSIIADTAGTYTVTSTLNSCTSAPGSVSVAQVLLVLTVTPTQPLCIGETGSVVLNASGGAGGYVFNSTPTSNLAAGTYNYSVTDANGCAKNKTVSIGVTVATWTGGLDNNWHNPGNWDIGKVPTSTTHVIIPVTANECIISTADATAASIQSKTGSSIKTDNGRIITLAGKCTILPL